MSSSHLVTIEEKQPLSKSLLWKCQAAYFQQMGVRAWTGDLPFFITSNPYIANRYARLIISYIRDCLRSANGINSQPFYILELGAGCGQFSFHCVRELLKLKEQLQLDVDICYVMSDFAEENIAFWQHQKVLQPLFKAGILDCARYNVEEPWAIKLRQRGTLLKEKGVANPLTVIANYVVDSTRQDAFRVINGRFHEALIRLRSEEENLDENGWPKRLDKLTYDFCYRPLRRKNRHYKQQYWNRVLNSYVGVIDNSSFTLPAGMFHCLDHLCQLSNDRLMLLATDKARTNASDFSGYPDPAPAFHGNCFSFTVNFHAIGEYFCQQGGVIFHQPPDQSFYSSVETSIFILGSSRDQLFDIKVAVDESLHRLSAANYYKLHTLLDKKGFTIHGLLVQMYLCDWDPYVLTAYMKEIEVDLPEAEEHIIAAFVTGMERAASNIYRLPVMIDHYFIIARIYHIGRQYDKAITFYEQSLKLDTDQSVDEEFFRAQFYLGCCYDATSQYSLALTTLQAAEKLRPDNKEVKSYLAQLQKKEQINL